MPLRPTLSFDVITPLHAAGVRFIEDTWRALRTQSDGNWRGNRWHWTILENNGAVVPSSIREDARVTVLQGEGLQNIGRLKRLLCDATHAPYIVELDCDDLLDSTTLAELAIRFELGADFVYSDTAEFFDHGDDKWQACWQHYPFGEAYGWKNYPVHFAGHDLIAMHSPPVTPQNLRLVDWSPNHVRAWRRSAYYNAGGHDPELAVGDDHDLCVRMFLSGAKFMAVPRCLYFYRVHGQNTVAIKNAAIREQTWKNYDRHIYELAEKFADDAGLAKIDLCSGQSCPPQYTPLDKLLGNDLEQRWPLGDGEVGCIRAFDALEHLRDPIHTMNECYRVLAPGGFLLTFTPSSNGLGAFCDPTHVSFWNQLSFRYYTDQNFARFIPGFTGRFQLARCREMFPTDWHRENNVPYVQAELIKLGEGYHPYGEVLWPRENERPSERAPA